MLNSESSVFTKEIPGKITFRGVVAGKRRLFVTDSMEDMTRLIGSQFKARSPVASKPSAGKTA